jgi:glycine betaine/proline transport system substrate-binding protein
VTRWLGRLYSVLLAALGVGAFVYVALVSSARKRAAAHVAPPLATPAVSSSRPRALRGAAIDKSRLPPIRIGWTAWADAEIVTHLAKRLLEDRMGYRVKLTMASIGIQYQGIASGDLDVMLMAWLPVTHRNYWVKVSDQVENLGPLYTRARIGWAVPDYVPKRELDSIADLSKPEVRQRIGSKVQGIDPGSGLMQASEKALKAYGLRGITLVSASGAAMTAALGRAIEHKSWVVVTAWSPHWMFARWKLRYLNDPKHVLGGNERIDALTRRGFYQDYPPEVTEFFTRMFLPLDQLEATMLEASKTSVSHAVDDYIRRHPKRVNYWVTGTFE